jgi:uncharacterized membrane protein YedE/YeeE
MTRPERILAFLDVGGAWNPSLAFVMAGAIGVTAIAFRVASRRGRPLLGGDFRWSDPGAPIDRDLLVGAALFGLGWGLSGLCPGPAIVALVARERGELVFVGAMVAGMLLQSWIHERRGTASEKAGGGPPHDS